MKILVAGGAGFIGSNFLNYMIKKYPTYYFVCIDKLVFRDNINNLKDIINYSNFKFVEGNITDEKVIDELFNAEQFDLVVNFAAEVAVDYSIENPNIFLETNIIGTANLMNACIKYNVKRYHQISTDEVYGDLPLNSKMSYNEKVVLKPSNPYSASKAAADLLVMSYYRTYGLGTTISRSTNNYGPRQSTRALIPLVIDNALNNKKIPIFGIGKNVRDWLYVYDHVTAIDLIIHNSKVGEIYNISGQSKKTNIYVVKKILKLLNCSENLIYFTKDRLGHDLKYSINSNKIEKELGWSRIFNFEKGIKETVNWYKNRFYNNDR